MSFDSREKSRAQGQPAHLYFFRFGPATADTVTYTNSARPITFTDPINGQRTYAPLAITHGEVTASGTLDKSTLEVTLPDDTDVPVLFEGTPPSYPITLTIRQGHVDDGDFKVVWAGRILGCTFPGDHSAVLDGHLISTALRRSGLTRDYQVGCPLPLYGPQCRADKAAGTKTVALVGVNTPRIQVPAAWDTETRRPKYIGGMVEWVTPTGRTERRSIRKVEANGWLLLGGDTGTLATGSTVSVVIGCAHNTADCALVHNNIVNYGGQPAIPLKNPVGITNNFY